MRYMKSNIYLLPLLAAFSLPASAQLDNTVEVTNEVKPVVKDANKINVLPKVVETSATHKQVEYLDQSQPFKKFDVEPIRDYSCDAVYNGNKRGYLQLAGGSHGQVDAQGAYQFDFTNHDVLNIDLTLSGFNGKTLDNDYYDVKNWTSRFYKNRVAGKFNHRFDNGVDLYVKGGIENHVFNYMQSIYNLNSKSDKQRNSLVDAQAGITPYEVGDFVLSGEATIQMFHQGQPQSLDEKYNEAILKASGAAEYMFSDEHSVELSVELFKSGYDMDEVEGISHIHFMPHYVYKGDSFTLRAGIVGGTDGDFAPDLSIAYHAAPHGDLYVKAVGYDEDNTFRRLSALHPAFQLYKGVFENKIELDAEFHQIDACVGYRFAGRKGFSGDVNVGFDMASNVAEIMLISDQLNGLEYPWVRLCDAQRFYFNADFTYANKDRVKVDLKNGFNFRKHKTAYSDEWVNGSNAHPLLDLRWKADFKIVENLHAGINWELGYYESDGDAKDYERPVTNNLGLSVRYAFPIDMPLSVFVKGDNLLNQSFDRYFGYRNIGANVIAGVALSF